MMQFNIPKIVRPLYLRDYAEGFGVDPESGEDVPLWVWVNPPRAFLRKRDELVAEIIRRSTQTLIDQKKVSKKSKTAPVEPSAENLIAESFDVEEMQKLDAELRAWLAEVWSQGPDDSHLSADDIKTMADQTAETDPDFFPWLQRETVAMIVAHRTGQKKG